MIPGFFNDKEIRIPVLYLPATKGSQNFVIYFHGNSEDIGTCYRYLEYLNGSEETLGINCNMLIMEYPGYGTFTNCCPSEEHLLYCSSRV